MDLFSVPPTQTSIEQGSWIEYHPITSVVEDSPIEFDVNASGEDYVDFANTMLYVRAKLMAINGDNLVEDAAVGPVNLFLHSLFCQVDISLNGTLITASTNTYPYRAMLETLLSYGEDAKMSQLTSALYYKDQAGRMDSVDFADNAKNDGLHKRRSIASASREFDMMGRLHADIFFQDRYMLNEVGVRIKLVRSKNAFCVMGAGKVAITHASLFVRKVKILPSVFLAHAKTLERGTAKYPIRRVVCKSFAIPQNYLDVSHEKLFSGQLPTRIVIGLVTNRAFNGHVESNPFNFQHFNLSEIALYLDGQQQHAIRPIQPDYEHRLYIRAYDSLFAGTGKLCKDEGLFIGRGDYNSGYALYAFDLSADLGEDDHFSLVRQGSVRLALKFAAALAATITVVAYAEFENIIEVDRDRNVVFDFGV
ncbi:MAG: hypothetical protein GY822_21935 [Deltaproteobacteria bacterium]|nr:hypothetical protein [Deltaproteobacteria bacterium]